MRHNFLQSEIYCILLAIVVHEIKEMAKEKEGKLLTINRQRECKFKKYVDNI